MQLAPLNGCYRATKLHGVTFSKTARPSRQPLNVVIGEVSVCSAGCLLNSVRGVTWVCSFSNCLFVCLFVSVIVVTCIAANTAVCRQHSRCSGRLECKAVLLGERYQTV